ncbi:MAG: cbb3-type cytochrome c oxidase subunit I [Actinobacteria bacterium]|nr:cbb3-type cytochrome c oxidase subunit I [Actinomycetota bacterium]MBI3686884.1 cbb3-type cytochrome c oxidase subunit I [Actinomycetota bacterium]
MGYLTYQSSPPIPQRVVSTSGQPVFTGQDVRAGQDVFLRNGLMEYGSIFGHGAYLGPDFTADYLHRSADLVRAGYGAAGSDTAAQRTRTDFKTNRYDPTTGVLTFSDAQTAAFATLTAHYAEFFASPAGKTGLRPAAITDPTQIRQLTSYFAWSAWASAADRPGSDYSYTNNWPSEPLVGNAPSAHVVLWSVLSLIALLGGTGALFAAFGRWDWLGWHGRDQHELRFREPQRVRLTASQRATAWFFLTMTVLFLIQTLVGAASEHYRADLGSFFGLPLDHWLPYNLVRTWHVQLSLFWVSTSFLAAGVFLVPMITGRRDVKGQHLLTYTLLGALALVVVGSLLGELAGMRGAFGRAWSWLGMQGFEYLDLGKLWQLLLTVGMIFWVVILWRGLRKRLRAESRANLPWLFFFAALALPVVYATGLLARHDSGYTVTDFWRFMVVHLWVEDFLELFTTVMVAYIFVLLGVVREKVALRVIFLDIVLYSAGGVIGTAHHWYFNGEPAAVLGLGAFFSAFEVIPLTFLTVEAWSFIRLGARQEARSASDFPHRWAVMFLVAVGFWNFVGAGIFGFLINLPIVSYYEIGTALTANHAHAAMMGVYGMLAVGFAVFALRYLVPKDSWSDRLASISFWSLNVGLAWMVFVTLLPLGILQLYHAVDVGYYDARTLAYVGNRTNTLLEWLRLPGDVLFIVGGVGPLLWLAVRGALHRGRHHDLPDQDDQHLFTEVQHLEPAEASAAGSITGAAT